MRVRWDNLFAYLIGIAWANLLVSLIHGSVYERVGMSLVTSVLVLSVYVRAWEKVTGEVDG